MNILQLISDMRGNVAIMTALAMPVFIGFTGLAVDIGRLYYKKSELQGAADAAALYFTGQQTATRHFLLLGGRGSDVNALIGDSIRFASSNLPAGHDDKAILPGDFEYGEWDITNEVFIPEGPGTIARNAVRVSGRMTRETGRNNAPQTFFAKFFNMDSSISTESFAYAPIVPSFHVLDPVAGRAFQTAVNVDIDLGDTWVNSDAPNSVHNGGDEFGSPVLTHGGATGRTDLVFPGKYPLGDLLAHEANPPRGGCNFTNKEIDQAGSATISPGVYCGGLVVRNVDTLTLSPGLYHFVNGPLRILSAVRTEGEDVLLHFDGVGAQMEILSGEFRFSGRQSGDYEGYVVFSNRDTTGAAFHYMSAVGEFSGVFYAPASRVGFARDVDGICHSLCLVANRLQLDGGEFNWFPPHNGNTHSFTGAAARLPPPRALLPSLRPHLRAAPA